MDNFPLPAGAVPGQSLPAPQRLTVPTMGSNTNTVQRFRPRVTVEAIQYDGTNDMAIAEWTGCETSRSTSPDSELYISIPKGRLLTVDVGDWIIRGTTGGFFTSRPDAFPNHYEPLPAPVDPVRAAQEQVQKAQQALVDATHALAAAVATSAAPGVDISALSPNAQRMVNAFRGDQS